MSEQKADGVLLFGINGFGRIGRLVLRASLTEANKGRARCVAVNDPALDPQYMAYLLKYDSTHGRLAAAVDVKTNPEWSEAGEQDKSKPPVPAGFLTIDGVEISCFKTFKPVPWGDKGVDTVCESSGIFLTTDKANFHISGGKAKQVVISAPAKDEQTPMFVMGVNQEKYSGQPIISNASCTTNCLAPMAKVLDSEFEIINGLMTTVHATTSTQTTVDGAVKGFAKRASGRGAGQNIIPATTGAAIAVGKVLEHLNGKLTGMAFRVPTPDVSVVDLTVRLKRTPTKEEVTAAFEKAASGDLNGYMEVNSEMLVSSDFVTNPSSCVFDAQSTIIMDDLVKVVGWYDNEWGYSNRMVDLMVHAFQYRTKQA